MAAHQGKRESKGHEKEKGNERKLKELSKQKQSNPVITQLKTLTKQIINLTYNP